MIKRIRDAVTGKFASKVEAALRPRETIAEKVKIAHQRGARAQGPKPVVAKRRSRVDPVLELARILEIDAQRRGTQQGMRHEDWITCARWVKDQLEAHCVEMVVR